jgi:hypothetical protein
MMKKTIMISALLVFGAATMMSPLANAGDKVNGTGAQRHMADEFEKIKARRAVAKMDNYAAYTESMSRVARSAYDDANYFAVGLIARHFHPRYYILDIDSEDEIDMFPTKVIEIRISAKNMGSSNEKISR